MTESLSKIALSGSFYSERIAREAMWDERWMAIAKLVATPLFSKDRSRQVAAVVVTQDNELVTIGWNGFARGIDDNVECRHERPEKYEWTVHAEENALLNAARRGIATRGCKVYLPWYPCHKCANSMVQAGISEIITIEPDWNDPTFAKSFERAAQILKEGRVKVRTVIGEAPKQKAL